MKILYVILQWTWGILQTALGGLLFLFHCKDRRFTYHGAVVTVWRGKSSLALGGFLFITDEPFFYEKLKEEHTKEELFSRLLVHEYGHTVQSLILGPLYLLLMGIPSTVWGFSSSLAKRRKERGISYFSFFTERWANALGERVTGKPSMERLFID